MRILDPRRIPRAADYQITIQMSSEELMTMISWRASKQQKLEHVPQPIYEMIGTLYELVKDARL